MMFPLQLDVLFTLDGAMVSVVSKAFPGCMGVGFSEPEALDDLKRSIKIFLKEHLEAAVDQLFTAPVHEHIRLDASQKRKKVSFDLRPSLGLDDFIQPRKQTTMSFPLPRYDHAMNTDPQGVDFEIYYHPQNSQFPVRNLFEQLGLGMDLTGIQAAGMPHVAGQNDALIVGIPINFN